MLGQGWPIVLLVFDGFGVAAPSRGNAVTLSYLPNFTQLLRDYPAITLQASGEVVGLPWGEMGNSEVGHMNIGGGKIIYQSLPYINKAIFDGSFYTNQAFKDAIAHVKQNNSTLHLMGLVSDGGIHSSQNHLYALLELCQKEQVHNVAIHAFLDGRDTPHNSALHYIQQLQQRLQKMGFGKIATLAGRFWAMDRDNHWERIEAAYNAITQGQAKYTATDPAQAIEASYQRSVFDEELDPTVVVGLDNKPVATVQDNDAVLFFNFRADRARQLTKAFILPAFNKFNRVHYFHNLSFVTMMEYEKNLPVKIAFVPDQIANPVAKVVSEAGMLQLHIAETEKYAHVTFFLNGGREEAYQGEERVMIPSPRVSSYAEAPEMSAGGVRDAVINGIQSGKYHYIVANFANADMVGHTGNLEAAKRAVEFLDHCLGDIVEVVLRCDATLVITADHGNVEEMYNLQTGEIDKEHSTNPVPFLIIGNRWVPVKPLWPQIPMNDLSQLQPMGVLSDVAPSMLHLLGLPSPPDMTARSLIQ
ncbi:MAG: 2,3-bisphosphoglycerate-independent phosphoglycerate mutase [Candidatus Kerfeldbacteria bacterium]|nr:2,3-bisphosphoglycerate-independent phosphoglycerate mutase [Candidatus Kerfeldbacteria bacterium]